MPVVFTLHFLEPQDSAVMNQRLRERVKTGGGEGSADGIWGSYPQSPGTALLSSVRQVEEKVFAKRVLLLNRV